MFIRRTVFEQLISERTTAQAAATMLAQQVAATQATLDWLLVRMTQLEKERAQMLFTYTGVKVEVPEIAKDAPRTASAGNPLFDGVSLFNDIGDIEAGRQDISWNEDGTLKS